MTVQGDGKTGFQKCEPVFLDLLKEGTHRHSMLLRVLKYLLTWCGIGVSKARYEWINSSAFLASQEWIELRYQVLRASDGRCCLCGCGAADGAKLNVDHIKPRRTHPSLALVRSNLQVLCNLCNRGKGNRADDWRRSPKAARRSI